MADIKERTIAAQNFFVGMKFHSLLRPQSPQKILCSSNEGNKATEGRLA